MTTEEIWNLYHPEIRLFIKSKITDTDVAKDILQETFLIVHSKQHTVRDASKLKSWIYQVCRNQILQHFRKDLQNRSSDMTNVVDESQDTNVATDKLMVCMASFIKDLPEKYREPLSLVGFSNVKQLDLPKILKISYSGAKSRVQRAKKMLKANLEKCCKIAADQYGNIMETECQRNCACEG